MEEIVENLNLIKKSCLLIKSTSKAIGNTAIEQKDVLLDMLFRTLGDTLLGNLLASEDVIQAGKETIQEGATAAS